jgi:tRNA(Ile)-lysidine synthase
MIAPGDLVLVAISGGADSTALLHSLVQLKPTLKHRLRAAHLHHGIRGRAADADGEAAAALARRLRVPFIQHRVDAPAYAKAHHLSLEVAARELRYEWLEAAADRCRANRIATGHTRDDQAETVLLNLLRGAGPRGLAGIPPVRGRIIRPLLAVTHVEAKVCCRANGLAYRLDRSNLDLAFARNRLRRDIMPALQRLQPAVVSHLVRLAEIMRDEDDAFSELAEAILDRLGDVRERRISFSLSDFPALPKAIQRRVLRAAVARLKGNTLDLDLERTEALLRLALSGRTGAVIELPSGLQVERKYDELVIAAQPGAPQPPAPGEWTLPVPGEILLPEIGLRITARPSRSRRHPRDPFSALLDADKLTPPFTVRTRRRGDRFHAFGLVAPTKLQDFFVNAKVPRAERDRIPLVISAGRIVWVVGYRISEDSKVLDTTRRTIRLDAFRTKSRGGPDGCHFRDSRETAPRERVPRQGRLRRPAPRPHR